ncbi:MAG TPA: AprI/Inh family metalloprotease inhibitor [Methylocystis sp.]|nr:AprI/Inh family metalloprotease inhibitor [Methylocystis sp.]
MAASCALGQGRSGEVAGRYAVLRAEDKDTGCMLTLENRPAAGGLRAQLAPACRDNGFVIFDPVAWALERGRLVLTARKGHKTTFERDPHGVWRRDPKDGKALSLRPM